MKVKDLIEELEKYDGDLEVVVRRPYTEDMKPLTEVREMFPSLDKRILFFG